MGLNGGVRNQLNFDFFSSTFLEMFMGIFEDASLFENEAMLSHFLFLITQYYIYARANMSIE
jgi:hypothetical protein